MCHTGASPLYIGTIVYDLEKLRLFCNFASARSHLNGGVPTAFATLFTAQHMKTGIIIRFAIIGLLWLGVCFWFVTRLLAAGESVTLMSLFPLIASAVIVFVPLYKKYVKNGKKADSNK